MSTTLIVTIICVLLFALIFNASYPKEVNIFTRFDVLFLVIIFFFVYTRIFGLIANVSQINNAWSVMPISELDGQISGFSAWPWLLFRFWDGYFKFDFYMLTGFLAIGTTLLIIKFKNFSRQIIFNNFTVVYSIFVCIIFYFSYFTNSNVIVRDESIFGVNPNLLLGTLHLILVLIIPLLKYFKVKIDTFFIINFIWGVIILIIRAFSDKYVSFVFGIDFFFLEPIVMLLVSLISLLQLLISKYNKQNDRIKTRREIVESRRYKFE